MFNYETNLNETVFFAFLVVTKINVWCTLKNPFSFPGPQKA